jgi:uncharacterized protein YndB with AHSA1/START domain
MTRFRATAVIDKPVEEVFAFAADPENDPRWSSAVSKARRTSKSALGLGSRYEQVLRFVGRRLEVTFEVTGYEPNRTVEIGRFSGPLRSAVGRRTFESVPGGTRVTFIAEGRSGLFLNLVEPLVAAAGRREFRRALANLKQILEAER